MKEAINPFTPYFALFALLFAVGCAEQGADQGSAVEILPVANKAEREPAGGVVSDAAGLGLLNQYCIECHGPDKQKGKVRFDQFETTGPVALQELYGSTKAVVHFEEMPPDKAKQPSEAERAATLWVPRVQPR